VRDKNIPFERALLVDRETGKLIGPLGMDEILAGRAAKRSGQLIESAELVSATPEPIVKYINRKEQYEKGKAQRQKDKQNTRTQKTKEIQMSFQVADADMEHKLKKAREALEMRNKVVIAYMHKKGAPRLSPDEMRAKTEKTVELLADVGKESKPRDILPTGTANVYLDPLTK
jgi:translation initiation factor IF-3